MEYNHFDQVIKYVVFDLE
uniref:Uncharacterized protein n=1 Tax=Moniliophthora roreri TaxID=221103 RepID=A0A0W0FB01_MONRR